MMEPLTLFGALGIGLATSLHCVGMCGPLVVAMTSGGRSRTPARLLLFVGGKAVTYFALGLAAGTVGAAFGSDALGTDIFSFVVIFAGALMIIMGVYSLIQRVRTRPEGPPGALATLMGATLGSDRLPSALVAGLLAGLLPCGPVYAMVANALASGSTLMGGLVMLAFGVGTMPALLGTGVLSKVMTGRTRRIGEIVAAGAVVAMGLIIAWRGVSLLIAESAEQACGCCGAG
jgi:uncharacterized protein